MPVLSGMVVVCITDKCAPHVEDGKGNIRQIYFTETLVNELGALQPCAE